MTLARLDERGLARSRKGEPLGVRGGKARRIYRVSDEGRAALERSREVLGHMWAGIPTEGGA